MMQLTIINAVATDYGELNVLVMNVVATMVHLATSKCCSHYGACYLLVINVLHTTVPDWLIINVYLTMVHLICWL